MPRKSKTMEKPQATKDVNQPPVKSKRVIGVLKYKESFPQEMYDLMQEGAKDSELASHFGVARKTFYAWLKDYPEFKEAHERGLEACETYWVNLGKSFMFGNNKGAFNFWIAFMNRKFGWHKNSVEQSVSNNTQINIGSVSIHDNKNKQELLDFIQTELKTNTSIEKKEDETRQELITGIREQIERGAVSDSECDPTAE